MQRVFGDVPVSSDEPQQPGYVFVHNGPVRKGASVSIARLCPACPQHAVADHDLLGGLPVKRGYGLTTPSPTAAIVVDENAMVGGHRKGVVAGPKCEYLAHPVIRRGGYASEFAMPVESTPYAVAWFDLL